VSSGDLLWVSHHILLKLKKTHKEVQRILCVILKSTHIRIEDNLIVCEERKKEERKIECEGEEKEKKKKRKCTYRKEKKKKIESVKQSAPILDLPYPHVPSRKNI